MFWFFIIATAIVWLLLPDDNNAWSILDDKEDKK